MGQSRRLTIAVGACVLLLAALSALWIWYRVGMSSAEEMSAQAQAFLVRTRWIHEGIPPERLEAVLPRERVPGDAGPLYLGGLLRPDGRPAELPPRPDAALSALPEEQQKTLAALEHPSIAAVLRGSAMADCRMTRDSSSGEGGRAALPAEGCRRVVEIAVAASGLMEARGDAREAERLLRCAAGFGEHLTRDRRVEHLALGAEAAGRASAALARLYERGGDKDLAKRAAAAAAAWDETAARAATAALALRRAAVTPSGADFLARELPRIRLPALRAETLSALGRGWCYNLRERTLGPRAVRRSALKGALATADADEAALAARSLSELDSDAGSLLAEFSESIR
jgi:hypothetical protein